MSLLTTKKVNTGEIGSPSMLYLHVCIQRIKDIWVQISNIWNKVKWLSR